MIKHSEGYLAGWWDATVAWKGFYGRAEQVIVKHGLWEELKALGPTVHAAPGLSFDPEAFEKELERTRGLSPKPKP